MDILYKVHIPDSFLNRNMAAQSNEILDELCEKIRKKIENMRGPVEKVTFVEHNFKASERPHIEVDNFGRLPLVGGIKFDSKKVGHKEMVVAEDAGTNLLFELEGSKARYYGTLCGTEQERFNVTLDGRRFNYKYVTYVKMTLEEIKKIIQKRKYSYEIADEMDWR